MKIFVCEHISIGNYFQILTEVFFIGIAITCIAVVFVKEYDFKYKVVGAVMWYKNEPYDINEEERAVGVTWVAIGLALLAIALAVLQGWAFSIVLGCYRMFRDKHDWAHWIEHSKDIRAGSYDPLVQFGTLPR